MRRCQSPVSTGCTLFNKRDAGLLLDLGHGVSERSQSAIVKAIFNPLRTSIQISKRPKLHSTFDIALHHQNTKSALHGLRGKFCKSANYQTIRTLSQNRDGVLQRKRYLWTTLQLRKVSISGANIKRKKLVCSYFEKLRVLEVTEVKSICT